MRDISKDLARFRNVEESSFFDECTVGTYSGILGELNDITKTWIEGSEIICGINPNGGSKSYSDTSTKIQGDITIHLPLDTEVSLKDRIIVSKMGGITFVYPTTYEIISLDYGKGSIIAVCKQVEN